MFALEISGSPIPGPGDRNRYRFVHKNTGRMKTQFLKCRIIQKRLKAGSGQTVVFNCTVKLGLRIVSASQQGFDGTGVALDGRQRPLQLRRRMGLLGLIPI